MKTVIILSILFCAAAGPAFGDLTLTDADVNQIRLIIQEENKPIKEEIKSMKAEIAVLQTDSAVVKSELANLKATVKDLKGTVKDGFDRIYNLIIACIGIPLALLAIVATVWGILASRRSRRDQALEKRIETMAEELETLKKRQIVSS